jgi:PAS domain S-box-containing protein
MMERSAIGGGEGTGRTEGADRLFAGGGEMRARCRAMDWGATPLGPVEAWPPTLRTAVRQMMETPIAACLWCGPEYTLVYNDTYRVILGAKHEWSLGRSGAEVWDELWPVLREQFEQVRTGGPAVYVDESMLRMERLAGGEAEDAWFTYSLSALAEEDGRVLAVYNLAVEITEKIRTREALALAGTQMQDQQVELELSNQQLQENAAELEMQAEALQQQAALLEERTEDAETARRMAEEERARAAGILETMADAHFVLDAGFRFVSANAAMLRGTDYALSDLLGRSIWEMFPAAVGTGFERAYRRVVAERVPVHFVERYGDARLDLVAEANAYPAPGGGVAVFWRDITQRLRAEEALRQSEARYRTLFESMDEGFCLIEILLDGGGTPVDYRFVETNPAFVRQTGLVDAVGRTARELVPGLEPHWFEMYGRVALTGEALRFQNGSEPMGRWFDVYALRVGAPEQLRVALLFNDVTETHRAALERDRLLAELTGERERLRSLILHMPAPLALLTGPEHRHAIVNDAYRQVRGGGRDITGLSLREAFPELEGQGLYEIFDQVWATGEPWSGPETPVRLERDGAVHEAWFDARFQPVRDADGVMGILNFSVDVTAQVQARQQIERLLAQAQTARAEAEAARAEAESANRAKSEFLAVMSHELRTPLNAIGGYVELMEMGIRGPVTDQQRADLQRVQQSQRHLLGLINEVLNYARLETGTVHYDVEDVPVREAVASAELLVAPQARAQGLTLVVGSCPPSLVARADGEKVR